MRSYKPDPAHFKECERRIGGKKGWVHVAASYYHDVEPCLKEKIPVIWVNRNKRGARLRPEEADGRGQDPAARRPSCSARLVPSAVRAVALHADVVVATSARSGRRRARSSARARRGVRHRLAACCPDELEALPAIVEQAGFPVAGLLATHADWDHVLGRLAFPDAALGVRGDDRRAPARPSPATPQRELREFDEEHYVERPRPLALGAVQALPVPGTLEIGGARARAASRRRPHRRRHGDLWLQWAGVLVLRRLPLAGRDPDGLGERLARRLPRDARAAGAARRAGRRGSCPATAGRSTRRGRSAILREDVRLPGGAARAAGAPLPFARRTSAQRAHHADNVRKAGGDPPPRGAGDPPRGGRGGGRLLRRCWASSASSAPAGLRDRAVWLARDAVQVHLLLTDAPVAAPRGHVAIVATDHAAALGRLRAGGRPVDERPRHWGAPRAFTRTPAGHRVEVMAWAPPAARALPLPDPPLADGVVALRPWTLDDVAWMTAACQDPAIARFTSVPAPYTESDARAFIEGAAARRAAGDALVLAVVRAGDGAPLGSLGLQRFVWERAQGEIGFWVSAEAARARGRGPRDPTARPLGVPRARPGAFGVAGRGAERGVAARRRAGGLPP